ncbi:MAG TPA: PHP domain-containing protein [Candidatus Limiplasma sp.]|nr:PHP domain-containing protein [Candidatus Limiplasma sp.]
MSFLSCAHTHTTYCDGRTDIPAMVARAQALGFVSLGFSGHAYQGFDPNYSMSFCGQQAYHDELRALQKTHREQGITPKIYIGLEQDALVPQAQKEQNRAQFDYIIGSVHYLSNIMDGKKEAVDGPKDILVRFVTEVFDGDAVEMAKAYYRLLAASIQADKPDIIGHFDVVRKHAGVIGLDTDNPDYRRAALASLEAAYRGCRLLEVNTGNIARGYDTLPYPAGFLLDAWREMGGELTLTSDCHNADALDCAYAQVLPMLKSKGFKHLLRLGTGDELWDEVSL